MGVSARAPAARHHNAVRVLPAGDRDQGQARPQAREGEVTTQEGGMSSHVRKHELAQREERLAKIEEQVREGKLVIRPMTEAEKKKWGVK